MTLHPYAAPERPHVPSLTEFDEIDAENVEKDGLLSSIKYTGMQVGDKITPRWFGATADGESFDVIITPARVYPGDVESGVVVRVPADVVKASSGGWVFYSYYVNDTTESLRQFIFSGLRIRAQAERLSVLHAVPAHALTLQPDKLPAGDDFKLLFPLYQAAQAGDQVTVRLDAFPDDGSEGDEFAVDVRLNRNHLDAGAVSVNVPRYWFMWLEQGYVEGYYNITLVNGQKLESPKQCWDVDSSKVLPQLLEAPVVEGHVPGKPLDPAGFRNGLVIRVPAYPELELGDRVVMVWDAPAGRLHQVTRVDASSVGADFVVFRIPPAQLTDNAGSTVVLSYLFGRVGENLMSRALSLDITLVRDLAAPIVETAVADDGADRGRISGEMAAGGVYVRLPEGVRLPTERAEVHWEGRPGYGEFIALQPVSDDRPDRFFIPSEYVPANFGQGEKDQSRRFPVYYRLIDSNGSVDSRHYGLRITPVPRARYPQVSCSQAQSGRLSLANVPASGAAVTLAVWIFIKPGQLLTLTVSGVSQTGTATRMEILKNAEVTEQQARQGVAATLPRAFLQSLAVDDQFTLSAAVSFDGGEAYTPFRSLNLTLTR